MPSRSRLHPLPLRLRGPHWDPARDACPEPGCITVPNSYNEGPYCLLHTGLPEETPRAVSRELELEAKRGWRARGNPLTVRAILEGR